MGFSEHITTSNGGSLETNLRHFKFTHRQGFYSRAQCTNLKRIYTFRRLFSASVDVKGQSVADNFAKILSLSTTDEVDLKYSNFTFARACIHQTYSQRVNPPRKIDVCVMRKPDLYGYGISFKFSKNKSLFKTKTVRK